MEGLYNPCRQMTSPAAPRTCGGFPCCRQSRPWVALAPPARTRNRAMDNAIRFHKTGGPDVLRWETVPVGEPGPGEVRLRHVAVGLNFADTYFRSGLYPAKL